ncbi:hypothetical protein GGX14DRAFT_572552 [Mycena pura]|uniref:Uncharacterized protein n=1 Tax=Mycena pura TaxID=153505 RepID=A0AAD6V1L0_9AGAR|nr:hypothetical protein GGX14DRAFT_572552 [Mycena pura]
MGLPAELVDSVVDPLGSDKRALKVTSLLSRQWVPRSRHYLYSSIWLRVGEREHQWNYQRVDVFLALVSSPIATFISAVAEVSLVHKWEEVRESPILSVRAILAILETRGIRPTRLFFDCDSQLRLALSKPHVFGSSLVHLELVMGEEDYEALGGICAFPLLETLKASNAPVLDWILGLDDQAQRQITNLGFFHFEFGSHFAFGSQWLRVPSQYVESLTVDDCAYSDADCAPDLRSMRRLKRLKILSTLSDIPKMLRRILPQLQLSPARRTLESITLNFFYATGYDAQMWISVDEMLADVATYPCLRTIVISTSIDSFLEYSLSSLAQHCNNMPFALVLHEHLRHISKTTPSSFPSLASWGKMKSVPKTGKTGKTAVLGQEGSLVFCIFDKMGKTENRC